MKGYSTRYGLREFKGREKLKAIWKLVLLYNCEYFTQKMLQQCREWMSKNPWQKQKEVIIPLKTLSMCFETSDFLKIFFVETKGFLGADVITLGEGDPCFYLKLCR
ncbi:MAG: hypothetical protein NT116_03460 [Candidatus Parcubacteria bacterium]|nr:hypothetical protein [Candidatus Parcubacteria bacterium]